MVALILSFLFFGYALFLGFMLRDLEHRLQKINLERFLAEADGELSKEQKAADEVSLESIRKTMRILKMDICIFLIGGILSLLLALYT